MQVVDSQPWEWMLFEHSGKLILEANCNHSFLGYLYAIELNDSERSSYSSKGRDYLTELARNIHNSVPIMKDTKSIYAGRDVHEKYSQLTSEAVKNWRSKMYA